MEQSHGAKIHPHPFFYYSLQVIDRHGGKQGRSSKLLKAGTANPRPWRNSLPTCSLWLAQLLFHTAQAHLPKLGAVHSRLGPSYRSSMKKTAHRLTFRPSDGHFLVAVLLLRGPYLVTN